MPVQRASAAAPGPQYFDYGKEQDYQDRDPDEHGDFHVYRPG